MASRPIAYLFTVITFVMGGASASCLAPEEEMIFKIELRGDWSPLTFPKQYPKFRKNAQFSPLVGTVHNDEYTMWEEGRVVSRDFRYFVNEDVTSKLVNSIKRSPDANTAFLANKIKDGMGKTSKTFTATRDFHLLSFAVHLIPSPDWFVGTSKLDLCQGSSWLDEPITLDLRPYDAGTDQGFMFTSPDYDESSFKPVHQITSTYPNHPANSFYYPQLDQLPRIAHATISRVAASQVSLPVSAEKSRGPLEAVSSAGNPHQNIPSWFHGISTGNSNNVQLTPVDCAVTNWGAWGTCDDLCTVGVQRRYRIVQQKPLNGGRKCDSLIELRICNSKLAMKKAQKKKCANKKMKKERKKYNAKQMKKIQNSIDNLYLI
ncbi:putative spondin-2-like [Apostichopus japonicus]|uniref:Putative spondin-2-like n=1 Tax=Stichopus japonicus TaxID=307972 RepID=A0A2G8L7C7_STIJA|nr:putative spondin-2-like [Apostichopus japonicus]